MALYLDNNATTAIDPAVVEAMMPYFQGLYGNPSSVHRFGRMTRDALEQARVQVASLVAAQPAQLIFTSGGTEANNLAIYGPLAGRKPARLAVSAIEHSSVLEPAKAICKLGWQLDTLAVNEHCKVTKNTCAEILHKDTQLVSVMLANNETGVLQDIETLNSIVKEDGILFHTDASQAAGKIPVSFAELGVNLMTLSSHKLYGPQGVGALIVDRAIEIEPLIKGGGQEHGLRSGTENIAGIVGFGLAAELAAQKLQQRNALLMTMRTDLETGLMDLPEVSIFAKEAERLPNTVQFAVEGFEGETLLMELDRKGIAVSSGSACHSGQTEPSHVLMAMGVADETARSAIRVSFGKNNQADDVTQFVAALKDIVKQRKSY